MGVLSFRTSALNRPRSVMGGFSRLRPGVVMTVVGVVELNRCDVSPGAAQGAGEPADPVQGAELEVVDAEPGPSWRTHSSLESPISLGLGVVVAVPDVADGRARSGRGEPVAEADGDALTTRVAVMHEPVQAFPQRLVDKRRRRLRREVTRSDALRKGSAGQGRVGGPDSTAWREAVQQACLPLLVQTTPVVTGTAAGQMHRISRRISSR